MLYEIVIRVEVGDHEYTVREFAQAESADAVKRYARQYAAGLYVGATYDPDLDIYSNADAQWCLTRVAPVECLYAHVARADGRNGSATPIALVPWRTVQSTLTLATKVLRARADAGDAESVAGLKLRLGCNDVTLSTEAATLGCLLDEQRDAERARKA